MVSASNASFSYSNKEQTTSKIGKELGVRYLFGGKVEFGRKNAHQCFVVIG